MSDHRRRALGSWRSFHADAGTQIAIAHALVGLPALFLAIDAAVRWSRLPLPLAAQAALAAALYAAILWRWPLNTAPVSRRAIAVTAAILALAWLAAAALYDTSWDGTSYHLPGLLAVAEGWNPLFAASAIVPANVQANGMWTVRAALYALTGSVEGAKALNVLFIAAALFTLAPAWSLLRGRALTALELGLVYAAAGNPVALGQIFTFYVDGTLYECGLLLLAAVLLAGSPYRRAALGLIAASIVLITGAKVSGLYYAVVLAALPALAAWRRIAAPRRVAALALGTLALGTLVIGYRPYVTNPRDYGHLVELGQGGAIERPAAFGDRLPPAMLAASLLARTDVNPIVRLKLPVVVTPHELLSMGAPDTRIGGFGPLFALETILAVLAAGLVAIQRRGRGLGDPAFILALGLAAISAAFPEPWSARYAPFFWAVPIFLALGAGERQKLSRLCAALVLVLALANGGIAFAGNLARTVLGDDQLRIFLAELAAEHEEILIVPLPFRGFQFTAAHRLARAGIPFRIGAPATPAMALPQCARILRTDRIRYCLAARAADQVGR